MTDDPVGLRRTVVEGRIKSLMCGLRETENVRLSKKAAKAAG